MLKRLIPLAVLAGAQASFAQPSVDATTHFGFAVEDRSTTGFKNVGGSLFYLDATHPVGDGVSIGLRTLGQGGHGAAGAQYYRLATGPVATWKANDSWLFDLAIGRFEESALDADGGQIYRSSGVSAQLGYEHVWALGPRAEGAVGGFAAFHQGSLAQAAPETAAAATKLNSGLDHGLELALRVAL